MWTGMGEVLTPSIVKADPMPSSRSLYQGLCQGAVSGGCRLQGANLRIMSPECRPRDTVFSVLSPGYCPQGVTPKGLIPAPSHSHLSKTISVSLGFFMFMQTFILLLQLFLVAKEGSAVLHALNSLGQWGVICKILHPASFCCSM